MSKKRKTRKQKEKAQFRHTEQVQHVHIDTPTYSIDGLKTEKLAPANLKPKKNTEAPTLEKNYMRKDIMAISAASGLVVAFDILLFILLSTGAIKFNFLGY